MSGQPKHEHQVTIDLGRCLSWAHAEQKAAQAIRRYTNERARGRDARTDEQVLRDAEFEVHGAASRKTWDVTVRVTV